MNAVRDILSPIGDVDTVSAWPDSLPWPQVDSMRVNWDQPTDGIGTLFGPTRVRLANINASPSYEFEIWLTADECENFEAWYNDVIDLGGEMYLPWIGEGRIVTFTEYELVPIGNGWKLHALATTLRVDRDYCNRHACEAANALRMPVITDADADYPIISCDLPSQFWRPRLVDQFFSNDPIWTLTDEYHATDTFIADLGAADIWNGNVWQNGMPGVNAAITDTITADLSATDVFVDIPENWMWDAWVDQWYVRHRMVYIDDWEALWFDAANACRLLKDTLPPPWPIVEDRDWSLPRIISDNFPLEVYRAC